MQVGSIVKTIDGFKISDLIGAIVRIRSHAPGDLVTVIVELPSGGSKTYTFNLDSAPALP
jgi:putative serine protease PepD